MISAADKLAQFRTSDPVVADILITIAKSGRDPGLASLSAATGITPGELRALFARDSTTNQPLGTQAPRANATHQGATAGATTRYANLQAPLARINPQDIADANAQISLAQTPALRDAAVQVMTTILPKDALRLVKAMGVSVQVTTTINEPPSARVAQLVGPNYAKKIARENAQEKNMAGHYRYEMLEVTVRDVMPSALKTNLTHELMHALDFTVYESGGLRSERPDFQQLFARMSQSSRFPTDYASTEPRECFAECATMYLTEHVSVDGAGREQRRGPDYLKRHHPEMFAFMEHFFKVEIPATKKVPGLKVMGERSKNKMANLIALEKDMAATGRKLPAEEAVYFGERFLVIAALTRSPSDLAAAQKYLKMAAPLPQATLLLEDATALQRKLAS